MTTATPDTSCRKCGAEMPPVAKTKGSFGGFTFTTTAYRCQACGHWNDLKRRKPKKP